MARADGESGVHVYLSFVGAPPRLGGSVSRDESGDRAREEQD